MTIYVLDTDILTLFQDGNDAVCRRVLATPMGALAVSVISVEEQLSGWYTVLRRAKQAEQLARAYQRLADCVMFLGCFRVLSFTEPAIERFAQFKQQKLRIRHMDLRIAAITLENDGILITRNTTDFGQVPELRIEDWTV